MSEEKFAIASIGSTKVSIVSDQAARCPFYLLFDRSGDLLEALKNPFSDTAGRAAPQVAQFLADAGVTMVIAERFGHKMLSELASKQIDHLIAKGPAATAVKDIL